jgi:RNA polymerase sigma-70 factor (sigma-E family)
VDTRDDEDYVAYVSARLPALKRLAYLLCGGDDQANDLVQESLTRLYRHWRTARNVDNLDRYVRAIVVRAHIDETRRGWFKVRLFGAVPEPGTPAPMHDLDTAAVLSDALRRLPAGQRAVLVLRFLCDMPVEDVGEVLGCSTGTVKSQTSHGLAKLRELLKSHDFVMNAKETQP